MNRNIDIQDLLEKPVWQMTGEEYCQLTHYALSLSPNTGSSQAPAGRKDPKEDEWQWARRCLKKAKELHVRPYRRHR